MPNDDNGGHGRAARSVSHFGIPLIEADLERYSYNRCCKDKTTSKNPCLVTVSQKIQQKVKLEKKSILHSKIGDFKSASSKLEAGDLPLCYEHS